MPEILCTDNVPQYAIATFADCSIEWGFTHETCSPHHPQSNRFAYTAACQAQWYKSKDCTTAPQDHPSLCQTSLALSDAVQMLDMYCHTI